VGGGGQRQLDVAGGEVAESGELPAPDNERGVVALRVLEADR
jgi:hypothetical protein